MASGLLLAWQSGSHKDVERLGVAELSRAARRALAEGDLTEAPAASLPQKLLLW